MSTIFQNERIIRIWSLIGGSVLWGAAVFTAIRLESGIWPIGVALVILARLIYTGKKEKAVAFPL